MSWNMSATGTREAVRAEIKKYKPHQYQAKIAQELILDELSRPTDQSNWNPHTGQHEPVNGVIVEAYGHSSPQGDGWDKEGVISKSGGLTIKITPTQLHLAEPGQASTD